jgi:hypothetical protein
MNANKVEITEGTLKAVNPILFKTAGTVASNLKASQKGAAALLKEAISAEQFIAACQVVLIKAQLGDNEQLRKLFLQAIKMAVLRNRPEWLPKGYTIGWAKGEFRFREEAKRATPAPAPAPAPAPSLADKVKELETEKENLSNRLNNAITVTNQLASEGDRLKKAARIIARLLEQRSKLRARCEGLEMELTAMREVMDKTEKLVA